VEVCVRKWWKTGLTIALALLVPVRWVLDNIGRAQTVSDLPLLKYLLHPYFPPAAFTGCILVGTWAYYELRMKKEQAGFMGMPQNKSRYQHQAILGGATALAVFIIAPLIYGHYRRNSKSTETPAVAVGGVIQSAAAQTAQRVVAEPPPFTVQRKASWPTDGSKPTKKSMHEPELIPAAPPGPANSIVNNAGKIEDLQISGSDVIALPGGAGATILNAHPGSETSKVKIDNSRVLGSPSNTQPSQTSPAPRAFLRVSKGSNVTLDNVVGCGVGSTVRADGERNRIKVTNSSINDPKQCDWIEFVNQLKSHQSDIAMFVISWKAAQEAGWKGLPPDTKEAYRREFDTITEDLINTAGNGGQYSTAISGLYQKPPTFDLKRPE
jgi:hypothetical protein